MRKLKFNEWLAIGISLAVITFFFLLGTELFSGLFNSRDNTAMQEEGQIGGTNLSGEPGGTLIKEDVVVGDGAEATPGSILTVHYTGRLQNGVVFDSSVSRGQPFKFQLGAAEVIQGWEQGIAGMRVGGKRNLSIPPELGYGDAAIGPIPANSTLLFEVELLAVEK